MAENKTQIFKNTFEPSWKDFDDSFRKNLLKKIQGLGSLHRLTLGHEETNAEFSHRFYSALEETLQGGRFIEKWKEALEGPLPRSFDEMTEVFERYAVHPLHAFYLLLVYVQEHPMRAFFSGRDRWLPFNTITLSFKQELSDPLPTSVGYEFDDIQLERCPFLSAHPMMPLDDSFAPGALAVAAMQTQGGGGTTKPKPHPQHHWKDLIWVWHF
jgi:hypothetical protein